MLFIKPNVLVVFHPNTFWLSAPRFCRVFLLENPCGSGPPAIRVGLIHPAKTWHAILIAPSEWEKIGNKLETICWYMLIWKLTYFFFFDRWSFWLSNKNNSTKIAAVLALERIKGWETSHFWMIWSPQDLRKSGLFEVQLQVFCWRRSNMWIIFIFDMWYL